MMRLQWRTVRFLFLAWLLIFCAWLTWRLPTLGFFRLASWNAPLPQTGMVLVSYLDGKAIDAESLAMIATGWTVFWELWPLVVLSMLLGYPFGVLIPWLCRFVVLAEKVPKQEISPQEKELRELAANLSAEVWAKTLKLQDMHREARQAKARDFFDKGSYRRSEEKSCGPGAES